MRAHHDHKQTYIQGADDHPAAGSRSSSFQEGDEIAYEIRDNLVILTKASASPAENPFVTFEEWDSEADQKAYAKL